MLKNKKEAKRFEKILKGYTPGMEPLSATCSFVKEFLDPQPDRYDLTYRYEHSLRVALWGKRIAEVARLFLTKIGYCEEQIENICQAIRIHDKWNDVPEDATPFELSVRDADDLDRFDIMRVCMIGRSDIGERSARELIEVCEKRQQTLTDWQDRICGTDTAKAFWEEKLQMRRRFYEALQWEMQGTLEMEDLLWE